MPGSRGVAAGYSGTPLAQKLGIKPGHVVVLLDAPDGWPRKAGGHLSDVTEQSLRGELLPMGVVDVKVAALDEDWSGLRFMWRRT